MALPPLHNTTLSQGGSISLSFPSSPSLREQLSLPHVTAAPSVYEVLHLPVLAATSLRSAKRKRASLSKQPPLPRDKEVDAVDEAHPLLHRFLSGPADGASAVVDELPRNTLLANRQKSQVPLPSVKTAMEELGGADKMELLLQKLQDVPHSLAERANGESQTFPLSITDAVQNCVQHALDLPRDAVQVSCPEGEDPSVLHVQIPLRAPHRRKNCNKVSGRPYLLLRMDQRRGVLSLHIVELRYQGPHRHVEQSCAFLRKQPRTSTIVKRTGRKERSNRAPYVSDHTELPNFPTMQQQPLKVSQKGLDYPQLCAALGRPVLATAANVQNSRAGDSQFSSKLRVAVDSSRTVKEPPKSRKRHKLVQKSGGKNEPVAFDPLRPEETTPFNDEHRPLTFNAAIVFS